MRIMHPRKRTRRRKIKIKQPKKWKTTLICLLIPKNLKKSPRRLKMSLKVKITLQRTVISRLRWLITLVA